MAIMTKLKQTGQRLMDYSFALVQLWFEATQFDRNETKFF
jgi:hypothetical protein